jgi:hypothetical protein
MHLRKIIPILESTPPLLKDWLSSLPEKLIYSNEGNNTWSPYDIVGHLIHGEKTDWTVRIKIILSSDSNKNFEPFDRFAQFNDSKGKSIHQLIDEFTILRLANISYLISLELSENDFSRIGIHPAFGKVTLSELLHTWAAHDLNHLAQIARVLAFQFKGAVGPWKEYLPIMNRLNG